MNDLQPDVKQKIPRVLKLDKAGNPVAWLHWKDAVTLHWKGRVVWHLGDDESITLRGGKSLDGTQHVFHLPPIIACDDKTISHRKTKNPRLSKEALIKRDRNLCMYCGWAFDAKKLTVDHVKPTGMGGHNTWINTVAACRPCNHRKGCRTPEQAGMKLLAIPYAPCQAEYIVLKGRRILACQMEYLTKMIPETSRFHSS